MQLLVYSPDITPRIRYIFNFIFRDILKIELNITDDPQAFLRHAGPGISYGPAPIGDELFFKQHNFLLQKRLEEIPIETVRFGDQDVPFAVKNSALPFDVFAASFYFISRYEEYIHHKKHNYPFLAANSLQKKLKILDKPVVDEWALILKNMVMKKFPALPAGEKEFTHLPSISVSPEASGSENWIEKGAGILRSMLRREGRRELFDNLTGLSVNVEENIQFLNHAFKAHTLMPFYFIGAAGRILSNGMVSDFIAHIRTASNIGLRSPCPDADNRRTIRERMLILQEAGVKNEPVAQQLEDLGIPHCYLQLLRTGVYTDFSMGYRDTFGFRAGTCTPFYWYDLQLEKQSELKVFSYCLTDQALQAKGAGLAEHTFKLLIERVKTVEGTFCTSWDLNSLSGNVKFKKWRSVYQAMLHYADK